MCMSTGNTLHLLCDNAECIAILITNRVYFPDGLRHLIINDQTYCEGLRLSVPSLSIFSLCFQYRLCLCLCTPQLAVCVWMWYWWRQCAFRCVRVHLLRVFSALIVDNDHIIVCGDGLDHRVQSLSMRETGAGQCSRIDHKRKPAKISSIIFLILTLH